MITTLKWLLTFILFMGMFPIYIHIRMGNKTILNRLPWWLEPGVTVIVMIGPIVLTVLCGFWAAGMWVKP